MIVQRIIAPRSKLGTTREWNNTTLTEELNIDTKKEDADSLYAAMDWLLKRQCHIEQQLAQRHLSEKAMTLYDISSSYVEGECCSLAKFGHNRDGKRVQKSLFMVYSRIHIAARFRFRLIRATPMIPPPSSIKWKKSVTNLG
jgi:hypothetical protein